MFFGVMVKMCTENWVTACFWFRVYCFMLLLILEVTLAISVFSGFQSDGGKHRFNWIDGFESSRFWTDFRELVFWKSQPALQVVILMPIGLRLHCLSSSYIKWFTVLCLSVVTIFVIQRWFLVAIAPLVLVIDGADMYFEFFVL